MPKMRHFLVKVVLLILAGTLVTVVTVSPVRASVTTSFPWATPQPGFCDTVGLDGFLCEQNQPWIAGSDERTDVSVTGVRATFSFPNLSPSVIQTDNVLGAGIAVYVPSLNPDASAPGVDFAYYGFVNVNSSGTISFVSSGWITCEWNSCPSHYTSVQSCYQYQGTYFWGTCTGHTLNDRHWQLFVDQFKCNNCSISDKYLVQMAWVQNSYAQWNY